MKRRLVPIGVAGLLSLTLLIPAQAANASTPDTLRAAAQGTGVKIGTAVDMTALAEDAQYRTAVAALLDSISKDAGTQFICTTFRPEIVHVADKCYGVTFRNKTSSIDCVPTEEALHFVEGQKA